MSDSENIGPGTRLVQAGRRKAWTRGIVSTPIWRASTVLFDDVAALRDAARRSDEVLYYGRRGGPTQWSLADALTAIEPGAGGTTLHSSGTAAITTALLAVLDPGDELLMTDSAYEPTRIFCEGMLKRFGVTTRYYDPLVRGADIEALFGERTKAVFMESPGSLTFEVQDVPAICAAAKARGAVSLIDNTWATPLLFPAIARGVDISILSCTKYVAGHSDVMLGSATAIPGVFERVRKTAQIMGQCVSPDDAFLASRGLRTMGVRLQQQGAAALEVARWLQQQPLVSGVFHPALPGDSGHELWSRDFLGTAGLFAFAIDGDDAARTRLVDALRHFGIGFSWGGFESLALPIDPARIRSAMPWTLAGKMVRLQIGLEDPADLIADLAQGLVAAATP